MSLRRGHARAELMGDINVVSLIDVMMLLLVIFMITAPIMQGGVDVNLPSADARPLEPKSGLVVTVTVNSGVYVDEELMSDRDFRAAFKSLAAKRVKDGVYLRADSAVTVQRLMDVFSVIKAAGVENIGVVTQPLEGKGK